MSDRSEEEEQQLQSAINRLRAKTFAKARAEPTKEELLAAADQQKPGGIEPEPSPPSPRVPSDEEIRATQPDVDGEELARLILAAWGKEVKDPPKTVPSQDDPNRQETEDDAIRAEAIRRLRVPQGIRRGQTQGLSPSQSDPRKPTESTSSDKPDTPNSNSATRLLSNPSELSASEIALWDRLAVQAKAPDPQSGGSAWQIAALACSRRAGAKIVLRQTSDSQIAFALTKTLRGYLLGPLEAHWYFGSTLMGPDALGLLSDVVKELRADLQADRIEIVVPGLNPRGLHAKQINGAFPDAKKQTQDRHAAASLAGGIEGWLSRRSNNFRRNLKRAEHRAQMAGVVFERAQPSSLAEADVLYERMLAVERQSWKGPVRKGLLEIPTFYRMLLSAYAERNCARVMIARHGEDDVGFCFGGASGGHYRGQQTSYRDDMSGLSLGTLMHFETARWLCEEGAKMQHFGPLQRAMSYKLSFCEVELPSVLSAFRG